MIRALLCTAALVALSACGGGSSSPATGGGITTVNNVQPITVDAGPANIYANGAFTSVTVCVPGSSTNCQTISGVLVDTGSSGVRILSSALSIPLPQQNAPSGNPVAECLQFQDSVTWGPIQTADVQLAGEKASAVPIQVIGAPGLANIPSGCTSSGLPVQNTLQTLGANGILGVGSFRQDCGPACAQTGSGNPGLYYECDSLGCVVLAQPVAKQLQNPIWLFPQDNNGVIVSLPSVPSAGAATVAGSLIFGIGTQSNNAIGSATVLRLDATASFSTVYGSKTYGGCFLDTGSNGIYFLDSTTTGLPVCSGSGSSFYCPPSSLALSATNKGTSGPTSDVSFTVANADTLFANTVFTAFPTLAGPNPGVFDWGLPFFYGRRVFSAIEGQSTSAGTGPYIAY